MTANYVPDEGSLAAPLVLIGEAPGRTENERGKPFVGSSGYTLAAWWRSNGLQRSDFYITNFYGYFPGGGDASIDAHFKKHPDEREIWIRALHERLAALTNPYVIVPTGNKAMHALTGVTRFYTNEKSKPGITSVRGYFFEYTDLNDRKIKVIPTIHPAATFRNKAFERHCIYDWQRIAKESRMKDLAIPHRETIHSPSLPEIREYVEDVRANYTVLNIDIETPKQSGEEIIPGWIEELGGVYKSGKRKGQPRIKIHKEKRKKLKAHREIAMVGFSASRNLALTVPTNTSTFRYWGSDTDNEQAWGYIRDLCGMSSTQKIFQNGLFDTFWLNNYGVKVENWVFDTLALHHALYPDEQHSLNYQCSLDPIRARYWKSAGKEDDDTDSMEFNAAESYRIYNGLDCCLQFEVWEHRLAELQRAGMLDFYYHHYYHLFKPLLNLMLHGVRVDMAGRTAWHSKLRTEITEAHNKLAEIAGEPLHAAKSISNKKLQKYLYETLDLPTQYKKRAVGGKTATSDEVTVRKLYLKYPARLGPAYELILEAGRKQKLSTFLTKGPVDADERMRCEYTFTPKTGRLASRKNPKGMGSNLQNIDREVRSTFVADEGCVMLETDLAQAESRVVYTFAHATTANYKEKSVRENGEELYRIARLHPEVFDDHLRTGSIIFNIPEAQITSVQRYFAKKTRHGSNYDMHGERMSEEYLKDDIVRSPEECDRWLLALNRKDESIGEWRATIRKLVMRDKQLVNSWGRRALFKHVRLGEDIYRIAYAFLPQGEVGALLNQYGLIPVTQYIKENGMKTRVNLQVHDSLVFSCPPEEVWYIANFMNESLPRERMYWGLPLSIPCGFKVGPNWSGAGAKEWQRLPEREEMVEFAKGILA